MKLPSSVKCAALSASGYGLRYRSSARGPSSRIVLVGAAFGAAIGCGPSASPPVRPVVTLDTSDIERSRPSEPKQQPPPSACVLRGEALGHGIDLLIPQAHQPSSVEEPVRWAEVRANVDGRYRLNVAGAADGRAPLEVRTEAMRLTADAELDSVLVFAVAPLRFGATVTGFQGHGYRWSQSAAGGLRLRLDLETAIRPAAVYQELGCDAVRLGAVPSSPLATPSGFEERGLLVGEGMVPLFGDPEAATPELRFDAAVGQRVDVGQTANGRREVFFTGTGFAVRAWAPLERVGPAPVPR